MQKTLAYMAIVLVFILGVVSGSYLRGLRPGPESVPQRDTTWLHDTTYIPKPVPVDRWHYDTTYIAVPTPPADTTGHVPDTLIVPIPRETTFYTDKKTYEAWVTGFRASLDSIKVFQETAIVEVPVYKPVTKRWGVGVQAGVTYFPKQGFSPYVGIGVSYNLLSF